jgi:hypothetical protein
VGASAGVGASLTSAVWSPHASTQHVVNAENTNVERIRFIVLFLDF